MKIPFNLILNHAFSLIDLASSSDDLSVVIADEFDLYLKKCGWTEEEFEKELINYIDNNWESNIN